jgi:hypothetical protein
MKTTIITPDQFEEENHFYEKVVNAQLSPTILSFLSMSPSRIITRYLHLNPSANKQKLEFLLFNNPEYFKWAGADLFNTTNDDGEKKMVVIETNSCPSGQKSMPTLPNDEYGGYYKLIKNTFYPEIIKRDGDNLLPKGVLAVIYDKNHMEASGYACCMSSIFNENVYLVQCSKYDKDPSTRFTKDHVLEIRNSDNEWIIVRAAFRYVTQKPWNRIPINSKTFIFNPIIACLAGGRNKLLADKAYEMINTELSGSGLQLNLPYTIRQVKKNEIPMWVNNLGGYAVIKNPYSNAGQGVWTITCEEELDRFMKLEHEYNQFIVQSLVGNYKWSSKTPIGQLYHVGTVPDKHSKIYVADLRMMVHYDYTINSWRPLALYARRAKNFLENGPPQKGKSWDVLGTNLSIKKGDDQWDTDTNRLIIMDQKNFHKLGLGLDDLVNAYIQTVIAAVSIDKMSVTLNKGNVFDRELFKSMNPDAVLCNEIY